MNSNNDLIKKIMEFEKKYERGKIESMLEEKLKQNPDNTDLLLRLAVLELKGPFHDNYRSIEYLEKILKIEKNHPIAILILAYVNFFTFGMIDETFMKKLCTLETKSSEINSMLRYVASWFYEHYANRNPILQEKLLKESINFYQGHVNNYDDLADLYFKQGKKDEAKELIKKALNNVHKVYKIEDWVYDPTDVNELLYEFFNGIQLSSHKYELIKGKLNL